jgi:lysine 2,3-aminomutase
MRKEYFPQRITNYLQDRLELLEKKFGKDSNEYNALAIQYIYNSTEDKNSVESSQKHYEAGIMSQECINVERLYKRHCCIEINFNCLANCRYCLRSNYEKFTLSDTQMDFNADYVNSIQAEEVLITGGDPFLTLKKLSIFTDKILEKAPSLKVIRIATRVFTQEPKAITSNIVGLLSKLNERIRVEVATQINSYIELEDDPVIDAFGKITKIGIPVYSQNVFLKGVNDTPEKLIRLYHQMRMLGIEAHYLFHSVPMIGTHHLRPTVKKMVECYEGLVNSGQVTGRSKPLLALMTEIGKITITPYNYYNDNSGVIKLRSNYKYSDRIAYNPDWQVPESAWINEDGYLCINYIDGED